MTENTEIVTVYVFNSHVFLMHKSANVMSIASRVHQLDMCLQMDSIFDIKWKRVGSIYNKTDISMYLISMAHAYSSVLLL